MVAAFALAVAVAVLVAVISSNSRSCIGLGGIACAHKRNKSQKKKHNPLLSLSFP